MAKPKSPHTQSQQNTSFAQDDVNPNELEQRVGTDIDAAAYENRDGAQTAGGRSPRHTPGSAQPHNTEPASAAFEGGLTSRVFEDENKQGISSHSSKDEAPGQRKVVSKRGDARAGLDHSGKAGKR
jgi:hypothetical protein